MKPELLDELQSLSAEHPVFAVKEIVARYTGERGVAIPILQDIQAVFGYVSPEMIMRASEFSGIPAGELYSIVTFYAQFRLHPIGENLIQVCHGTACHLAGAEKITEALQFETKAEAGKTSPDNLFTLEKVACIGCCSLAPVMNMGDETFGHLTPDKVKKVIKKVRKDAAEKSADSSDGKGGSANG